MPKTVGVDPSPFTVRKPEETGKSVLGCVCVCVSLSLFFFIVVFNGGGDCVMTPDVLVSLCPDM